MSGATNDAVELAATERDRDPAALVGVYSEDGHGATASGEGPPGPAHSFAYRSRAVST